MKLYRSSNQWLLERTDGVRRRLLSDPFEDPLDAWQTGEAVSPDVPLAAPAVPSKIIGIGRNYRDHAAELNNPMPEEPLLFLKAPSSLVGSGEAIVLPPESETVHFEGEIAVVAGRRLSRGATAEEARAAIFGIAPACDVTARDLQRRDATFARGKSFDTFCPLGPGLSLLEGDFDLETLSVTTRINGEVRQQAPLGDMAWGPVDLLLYVSRMMTLEPGDVLLTGTPAGVGPLQAGDTVEVEIPGLDTLTNPVVAYSP